MPPPGAARPPSRAPCPAPPGGFYVSTDDAPLRTAAVKRAEVDARLLGHAPGERRGEDALAMGLVVPVRLNLWRPAARAFGRRRGRRCGWAALGRRGLPFSLGSGCAGRCGSRGAVRALALGDEHGDRRVHGHALRAVRDEDLAQGPLVHGLDLHRGLVRLDLGDHVAGADRVAFLLEPARERTLRHRRREGGHEDVGCHQTIFRTASTTQLGWGSASFSRLAA